MTEQATTKSFCNNCHSTTKHNVLASKDSQGAVEQMDDDGYHYYYGWRTRSEMLECAGCGCTSLRDTINEDSGEETILLHPPRVSRRRPSWLSSVPNEIRALMSEVYTALDADSRRLALMGARAVMDMLIVEKVGDAGSFAEKLKQLEASAVVTKSGREVLDAALDAGNAVAHRGLRPSAADTAAVLDIVENVLQSVYCLGEVARRLRQSTPPRSPRVKPSA